VNLVLTKRGQYAVKAARALALAYDGEYHKTREVVSATGLPARFAPQILADLREAGITEARAGPSGGHRLSRPPHDISLLEVINAAEHTLIESRCMIKGKRCPPAEKCVVHPVWAAAQTALLESLEAATLSDLVSEEGLPDEDGPLGAASIAASL
jgi:Rrf2 family iron-sulfur cluster assembly transcriptional regulator